MVNGRRSRSSSRDKATTAEQGVDIAAMAPVDGEVLESEDESVDQRIGEQNSREIFAMRQSFAQHQAESTATLKALQGEISKLSSMMLSMRTAWSFPTTDEQAPPAPTADGGKSRSFHTPPPPQSHINENVLVIKRSYVVTETRVDNNLKQAKLAAIINQDRKSVV